MKMTTTRRNQPFSIPISNEFFDARPEHIRRPEVQTENATGPDTDTLRMKHGEPAVVRTTTMSLTLLKMILAAIKNSEL